MVLSARSDTSSFEEGIYLVDPGTDRVRPYLATRFSERAPAISADGRWLAYQSDETGRMQVYVRAFPGGGRPWPIGGEIGLAPAWSPEGDRLYYGRRVGLMAVELQVDEEVRVLSETPFFDSEDGRSFSFSGSGGAVYDVASAGRVLAILSRGTPSADAERAHPIIFINVFQEIRERLGES